MAKRSFDNIRNSILFSLDTGEKTVNEIARTTNINWRTVDHHLTYLLGRGMVEKTLDTAYAKIFALSEDGKGIICRNKINNIYANLKRKV